jgi:hypothetical protein
MKNIPKTSLEDHLELLGGMKEIGTDDFFYTRLKARMEERNQQKNWNLPLNPAFLIGILFAFLVINSILLMQVQEEREPDLKTSMYDFARSYDQIPDFNY